MASNRKRLAKQRRQQRDRGAAGKGTSKYAQKVARGRENMMYGRVIHRSR